MDELDLQEATIRDDVYEKLNSLIAGLKEVPVGLPLVWLYVWDVVVAQYEQHSGPIQHGQEEAVPEGVTLKQIWDKFWTDADKTGFTLEYGTQDLYDSIDDWMRDNDFLVCLDDDGWLDDLTDEEQFDTIEANQLQKGNTMEENHEHFWDTPSNINLIAECECGENLERVTE